MSARPTHAVATRSARKLLPALSLALLLPTLAVADVYDPIGWYSIDGGGAIGSVGGTYRLSGTIGQPDAGTLTGGSYTLRGGSWRGGTPPTADALPSGAMPLSFQFRAPVPNPARSQSRLSFDLPASAEARLRVYDVSGRAVRTMGFGRLPAGRHDRVWNTADDEGRLLPGGVYFMRLEAGANQALKKVLVLR